MTIHIPQCVKQQEPGEVDGPRGSWSNRREEEEEEEEEAIESETQAD